MLSNELIIILIRQQCNKFHLHTLKYATTTKLI